MRRYRSPNQWVDGATVHNALRGKMVVRVDEVQRGPTNPDLAVLASVAAIEAWARAVSLLPRELEHLVMNAPDGSSYVVVPKQHWERVQQKLAAL
jgi:hypothetical protein